MSSLALDIFERLIHQVDQVEAAASQAEVGPHPEHAQIVRRSGFVLAVASIDSYFHEQATARLTDAARASSTDANRVANYCQSVSAAEVSGPTGESYIRLRLSYKTLVSPRSVDLALTAAALDCAAIWHQTAFALGTRPDRLRLQMELFYDRRNQIAHEGDWDAVQLDFRPMERTHLTDCVDFLKRLARTIDLYL